MMNLVIDGKDLQAYLVQEHGARACERISETLQTIPAARADSIVEWMISLAQARAAESLGTTVPPGISSPPVAQAPDPAQDEIPM